MRWCMPLWLLFLCALCPLGARAESADIWTTGQTEQGGAGNSLNAITIHNIVSVQKDGAILIEARFKGVKGHFSHGLRRGYSSSTRFIEKAPVEFVSATVDGKPAEASLVMSAGEPSAVHIVPPSEGAHDYVLRLKTSDCVLFRNNAYDVTVFNLVNPEHGDSWTCMADLNGDTLMAQILTNVIIGNTSSGKGDHFWDGGEGNLLKALILYVDQDPTRDPEEKHLSAAYRLLTQNTEQQLTAIFDRLPLSHPARPPYSLFAQASETVKSGIIIGLGTRLQVLPNEAVQRITSQSDIDLTAPAKHKCAYYIVLSDQDSSMAFLSSLFFSFLFIKLTRYADSRPSGACDVPVNLILDEFNNIGRIGGAADGSDFARTLSVIRSRDIRVMLAIQSLGQLQNRYANTLWAEIIGNCDIQLMLGCTDGVTAEYFSARSGDMSVTIKSTMTVRQTMAVAQMIPQYRQTEGQGRRRLLTPDEVLRLPNTDLLCVTRGCNMLRLKKLDYTGHRMSRELQHCSILDYTPMIHVPRKPELPQQPSMPSSDAALPEQSGSDGEKKAKKKREKLYSSSKPPQNF